jgi:hypothetical protein
MFYQSASSAVARSVSMVERGNQGFAHTHEGHSGTGDWRSNTLDRHREGIPCQMLFRGKDVPRRHRFREEQEGESGRWMTWSVILRGVNVTYKSGQPHKRTHLHDCIRM